ncbi:hypothetical protein [Microbacterium suaedae]|uniref:hypothetical protein n=1 Tax=Microbacterium suaedae TaxID=2067813 RepID=UPI0013A6590A|nr:hypothetical protein [Microbacterium suaedae]
MTIFCGVLMGFVPPLGLALAVWIFPAFTGLALFIFPLSTMSLLTSIIGTSVWLLSERLRLIPIAGAVLVTAAALVASFQ